jgi:PAS domain S-box-containing protein
MMLMPLAAVTAILLARQQQRLAALAQEAGRLRRSVHDLESLFEQAPLGMAVYDADLRIVRINRLLADIDGMSIEDHIGKTVREIVPDLADDIEPALARVLHTRQPIVGLVFDGPTGAHPDTKRTWRQSIYPMSGPAGELLGVSTTVEDITEQQRLALALGDSEQRERRRAAELESVMDAAPVAIFIAHDCDCRQVTTNATGRRLLRLSPGESPSITGPGTRSYELCEDGRALDPDHLPLQRAAALGEETWGRTLSIRFACGGVLHLLVNAVPLRDDTGRVRGAAAAFINVTDRHTAAAG